MQRIVRMTAKQANFFLNTIRTPKVPEESGKPTPKFSNGKVRMLNRLADAAEKADKDNGYLSGLEAIAEESQDDFNSQVASLTNNEQSLVGLIQNRVNAQSAVRQRQLVKDKGNFVLEMRFDEADLEAARQEWEKREFEGVSRDLEEVVSAIGDALSVVVKAGDLTILADSAKEKTA